MTFKIQQDIRFEPKGTFDLALLLELAAKDPELGEFIYSKKLTDTIVFFLGKEAVGFAIPRKDSDGRYRTGPIFVKVGYRRKGVAKAFVLDYFKGNRKGRAYIAENNHASQALYNSAGFKKSGGYISEKRIGGETLYEWLKG